MYYFITNIHGASGKALLVWKTVKKILLEKNIPFKMLLSKYKGHSGLLAREACEMENGEKNIVVVGGDGTINEVLNGIAPFKDVRLGVIPTGSGNDFCRGTGIKRGRRNTRKVLEKILSSDGSKKIDIGKVTADGGKSRFFAISSGIGMDAIVCKKVDGSKLKKALNYIKMGGSAYILLTLHTLSTMKFYKIKAKLDGMELSFNKLIFLSSMNLLAEGGGVKMAPHAAKDDGKLTMCAVNGIPRFLSYFAFPFLVFGAHEKLSGFTVRKFNTLEVESENEMTLHTDGEFVGDVKHIKWEVLPSYLAVLN